MGFPQKVSQLSIEPTSFFGHNPDSQQFKHKQDRTLLLHVFGFETDGAASLICQ